MLPLDRPAPSLEARAAWVAHREARIARYGSAPVVAATRLAAEARAIEVRDDEAADERPVWQRGRAGTSIGRAVHAVLQTVPLATGDGVDDVAAAQAAAEGVAGRAAEVAARARAALASPSVREAAAGRHWRELFVAARLGDRTVEGYVDLLYETAAGDLVVVDYKTDAAAGDEELDAAVDRYRLQGAAYAAAVESVVGRPVSRCVFVFARPGRAVEREVTDLRGAVDEVRALVAG